MATYYREYFKSYQQDETTAAKLVAIFEVGAHEDQVLTVKKADGAFVTSYSTATQIEGNLYQIAIDDDDIDTIGALVYKSVGATHTHYIFGLSVVEHDIQEAIQDIRQAVGYGLEEANTDGDTIKFYNIDGVTVRLTLTKSKDGTKTTWTPS